MHHFAYVDDLSPFDAAVLPTHADLNQRDDSMATPLHVAAVVGAARFGGGLLMLRADVAPLDLRQRTPLHLAAGNGHQLVVEKVTQYAVTSGVTLDIDKRDDSGRTALFLAADAGHIDAARTLCDAGADLSIFDYAGVTPLHVAAAHGHTVRGGGGGG